MSGSLQLTPSRARRIAVRAQLLSSPRPKTIDEVVRSLGSVQMDATSAVARTEHLVLWSRLGTRFRVAELERLLWRDKVLFEYWAHILPTADYRIHRESMRRRGRGDSARERYVAEWLRANAAFRRYVLRELRARGPLLTRQLEDRAVDGWRTGGWNDAGKSTAMMLELLWDRGEVMVVGRDGQQRVWDLAERRLPVDEPRPPAREVTRRILDHQLRARGIAKRAQFGFAFGGRPPGWERALAELIREGVAIPAEVEGLRGRWFVHAEAIEGSFRPRTVLLSPFDDLIELRDRTEQLFGFRYRLEIYVPKDKREFGYFVMPILHGDGLVGRIDPLYDRRAGVLKVNAVYAEPDAPTEAGPSIARTINELGSWLGASEVRYPRRVPARWARALRG